MTTKKLANIIDAEIAQGSYTSLSMGERIAKDLVDKGIVGEFTAEQYARILETSREMAIAIQELEDINLNTLDIYSWSDFACRLDKLFTARQVYKEVQYKIVEEIENTEEE